MLRKVEEVWKKNSLSALSGCSKIVVEVKASDLPHVLELWQGHAPCKIILLQQSLFLCQLNFMEIM